MNRLNKAEHPQEEGNYSVSKEEISEMLKLAFECGKRLYPIVTFEDFQNDLFKQIGVE